jgi:hypothetical protein
MAPDLATSPDFWLPERLAKLGTFIELERNTYAEFLDLADRWLAQIRNPVLRPGGVAGIDPNGVHAGDLIWRNGIREFTQDAIVPILGRAYADNFDGDFPFTHRPFVTAHLQTVENRLVHIPDEVFNDMRKILQEGTNEGRSIPEIAARVQRELLTSGSDNWRNRATVIARTETIGAYNAGTSDAFDAVAETLEIDMEKVWLATDDDRTRHTHREADGQRVPLSSTFTVGGVALDFPGDPTGPPQEVIQCRCTMLLVEPGEALDMSDRQLLASAGPAFVEPTTLGHALLASGLPGEWAVVDGWDHSLCVLEFCRAPLHPGPCKGWKHTLKQIAPGVYDALERVRVAKLEEKRKAKIAALKAAGKPIPKALLKPIKPSADPKPPPATPGTIGVPPMVGTEAPLSPATEAKLTAVSAKVKKEFDPETIKAKKAAKAKAHKLAQAEAMSKMAAQQKAEKEQKAKAAAQAKAKADADAAKAKADAEKAAPPKVDSDTPGFVPTDQQAAAMEAAQGLLDTENTIDAYVDLDVDDFEELPPHVRAKILANIEMLAYSDALSPLEQGQMKGKFNDLTGKLPQKPKQAAPPTTVAEKALDTPPADPPAAAHAKAEKILAEAGVVPDEVHILSYDALTPAEFKALPPHAQAKILADLQDVATNMDNEDWVKAEAKGMFEAYSGQKAPGAAPPSPEAADPDQANVTAVPDVPAPAQTPAAAKAAKIAKAPGATPWKDRLAAYSALSEADVATLSDEEFANIHKDLEALHAWYTKKNLKMGAKGVQNVIDDLDAAKAATAPDPDAPDPDAPPIGSEVAPSVADVLEPSAPAGPVYNHYQQKMIDGLDAGDPTAAGTPLTPAEYQGLPAATKLKLAAALAEIDTKQAHKLYETYFGVPHPKAGHATSTDPPPTPEPDTPTLPTSPPKNTFQEWQSAKANVGNNYKGKNKQVADAIKGGHFTGRLAKYDTYIKDKATFQKMPPELRAAIIADLDNMAANPGHFTPEHVQLAIELRDRFTGKPPGTDFTAPTTGQPKQFPSQAAENAHNIALNPGMHTTQARLAAYKKLSVVGFKKLPPDTQEAIAADLTNINNDPTGSVLESNQAISLHLKLTGEQVGDPFTPSDPAASTPKKKKFASEAAQAAYDAVGQEGSPDSKYDAYAGMTKEDFESLPATHQKTILAHIKGMHGTPYQQKKDLITNLIGTFPIPYGWKPKTAGAKKAEAAKKLTAAEVAKKAADYQGATAGQTFKQKEQAALSNYAGLDSAPLSHGTWGSGGNIESHPPVNGVSGPQMHEAVTRYKGSSYQDINTALRNAKGGPLNASSSTQRTIRHLDAAMQASPLPEAVAMWRGGGSGKGMFGAALNGDLTGVEFTEHGYGSTSASQAKAQAFAGYGGVLMRAIAPPGVGAVRVSGKEYESELLLERGLRWRVVADHGMSGGYRRIDIEVIP